MKTDDIYSLEWTNKVKVIGRAFVYNDCLWLSYSGTGVEFTCNDGFRTVLASDMIGQDDVGERELLRRFLFENSHRLPLV